ncbi:MAG: zinc-binding dehydrogenase [Gammaproteobacteria bacterium]
MLDGHIRPIIDSIFKFDEVKFAHTRMEENLNFGKILLTINQ